MSTETGYIVCNLAVLPGWLLLIFAPRWRPSAGLVAPVVIPGALALLYLVLMATNIGSGEGGLTSLAELAKLFATAENLLLAGWIHYLAFDLFIGAWQVREGQRLGIAHGLTVPCLLLTFAFGPIGLLAYFGVRLSKTKSLSLGVRTA